MGMIRPPAVAGAYYPSSPQTLRAAVRDFLEAAPVPEDAPCPKAVIAPHAGYVYSGPVAGQALAPLQRGRGRISRVVVIGPSHRVGFHGIAAASAQGFATPLGIVPVDRAAIAAAQARAPLSELDAPHAVEHCIEVQLPFLQIMLGQFDLVPLVVGRASVEDVSAVLGALWGGPETVIIVSSDLSHDLDHRSAGELDRRTKTAIETLSPQAIGPGQACGRLAINGLLATAAARGLHPVTLALKTSAHSGGETDKVVGYGAFAFYEEADAARLGDAETPDEAEIRRHGQLLVALARAAIETRLKGEADAGLPRGLPSLLLTQGASFVTLRQKGALRGCIGSATAWRPLAWDVIGNALGAAFGDPRFPPLGAEEMAQTAISISVLTPHQPLAFADEADLLGQLRPGQDGLIIEDHGRCALFLPQVWKALPEPDAFLCQLKTKAGFTPDYWSDGMRAHRFRAVDLH